MNDGFPDKIPGALWDAFDQLRASFDQHVAPRFGSGFTGFGVGHADDRRDPRGQTTGDVRAAVLVLLTERPMHGFQLIQQIEQRSGGSWKPGAGEVYPTLQMMTDEGLVVAEVVDGRTSYALTETGREAAGSAERPAAWESSSSRGGGSTMASLAKAGIDLAQAAAQVGRTGSPAQVDEAVAILAEARRRLYALLAQESDESQARPQG